MLRLFILVKDFICNEYSNIVRPWTVGQRGIIQAKCSWMYLARPLAKMLDWIEFSIMSVGKRSQKQTRLSSCNIESTVMSPSPLAPIS